jgi:hypothetical protein
MGLTREDQHSRRDVLAFESHIELIALFNRDADVGFPVLDECRIFTGSPLPLMKV